MIRKSLLAVILGATLLSASAETFLAVEGEMLLPQGGASFDRKAGAMLTAGTYFSDFWAVEGQLGLLDDAASFGANLLGHFSTIPVYDRFFGFSPFDPFFTLGARGFLHDHRGQVGPAVGLGAFYHLSEHWSLRADASAFLGLDTSRDVFFTLACGVQYTF